MRHNQLTHTFHSWWRILSFIRIFGLMGSFLSIILAPMHSLAENTQQMGATVFPASARMTPPNQEEFQALLDRVSFLEDQQSSILDEIAQRVIFGGYGALEFESFSKNRTTFEGKLEILVSGQIPDRIRFYNEIDLGVPEGEAKAEQSYVDFLLSQWINLRAGVLLIPFGKFNLDHFDPRRDLTDRPIVATQIVPTTWSDLGVSLFGLIPISSDVKGSYEIQIINGLTNTFADTSTTPPTPGTL